jgi:hypothetical protein
MGQIKIRRPTQSRDIRDVISFEDGHLPEPGKPHGNEEEAVSPPQDLSLP